MHNKGQRRQVVRGVEEARLLRLLLLVGLFVSRVSLGNPCCVGRSW